MRGMKPLKGCVSTFLDDADKAPSATHIFRQRRSHRQYIKHRQLLTTLNASYARVKAKIVWLMRGMKNGLSSYLLVYLLHQR